MELLPAPTLKVVLLDYKLEDILSSVTDVLVF